MEVKNIFAETNRGILFDVVIFVVNLVLTNLLTRNFVELVQLASADDAFAKFVLGLFSLGMFVLPAAGAVLKRRHFHRRQRKGKKPFDPEGNFISGCLLFPIFYFVMTICISSAVMSLLGELFVGKNLLGKGAVFVPLVLVSFVLCGVQTFLVFRYFWPPKKEPKAAFLRGPTSELVGDVCLLLNMLMFQILWNFIVVQFPSERVTGVGDFAGRLFFLSFIAMLVYFPPRIFYLVEDINRRATWLTMLLANSPTILRVLFGENPRVTG